MEPPSQDTIARHLKEMKAGTAPGKDRINLELVQNEGTLIAGVTELIVKVWRSNNIPQSWLSTTQIPIPKKQFY